MKVDADEDGVGGDDAADALRYLVASKGAGGVVKRLRGHGAAMSRLQERTIELGRDTARRAGSANARGHGNTNASALNPAP